MSGIAGILHLDGRPADPMDLQRMVDAIAHRGPDGCHVWADGSVGLGHGMLHTTPESLHETLPLTDSAGRYTITADARIDNREELIRKLELSRRKVAYADSELILLAYREWGQGCVEHLLGDFAFAIWDARQRHLFVARDHFGVRPLFYVHRPGELFAFASEIKALHAARIVEFEPDDVKVAEFLLLPVNVDENATFWRGVRSLRAAHAIVVGRDLRLKTHRYWSLDPHREAPRGRSDDYYISQFREHFDEAVRCRLRSHRPVGAMLSGGLDSTAIACTAAEQMKANGGRVHTYSAVFDSIPEANERSFQEAAISRYADQMEPHFFAADEVSPLAFNRRLVWGMDRVNEGINSYIPFALYNRAGDDGVRVVLDGFDGDTTVSHGKAYLHELVNSWRWLSLHREIQAVVSGEGGKAEDARRAFRGWIKSYVRRQPLFTFLLRVWRRLSNRSSMDGAKQLDIDNAGYWIGDAWREYIDKRFIDRLGACLGGKAQRVTWRTEREHHHMMLTRPLMESALQSLDAKAALAGVEARFPFYDVRLVEYCLSLPGHLKMREGWTRWIERAAMKNILPAEVRWRRGKPNLSASYVKGLMKYERLTFERFAITVREDEYLAGLLDTDAIANLAMRFAEGDLAAQHQENERVLLYRALVLHHWLEQASTQDHEMNSYSMSSHSRAFGSAIR